MTVLQSHPSVSIPTETMQRMSRPGGCERPVELRRQAPRSRRGRSASRIVSRPVELADGVQGQAHPGGFVLLGALRVRLGDDLRVHPDRPDLSLAVAQVRASGDGGTPQMTKIPRPAIRRSTFASLVFLQTKMKTGGRRSSVVRGPVLKGLSPVIAVIWIAVLAHLSTASGSNDRLPAAFLPSGELGHDPAPDVEVGGPIGPGRDRPRRAEGS